MRPINEKLKEAIQEAGKKEFLSQGFQKASMRTSNAPYSDKSLSISNR